MVTMQRIEDAKPRLPRRMQHLQHMRHTPIAFCHSLQAIPHLASLGHEIVIRIDHQKGRELLVYGTVTMASLPRSSAGGFL